MGEHHATLKTGKYKSLIWKTLKGQCGVPRSRANLLTDDKYKLCSILLFKFIPMIFYIYISYCFCCTILAKKNPVHFALVSLQRSATFKLLHYIYIHYSFIKTLCIE